jgi:cytoskeletal protein RodZ
MKNQVRILWLGALVIFVSAGLALNAQQSAPQSSPDSTAPSAQQPAGPPTSDQPAPPPTDQATPPASSQTAPAAQPPSGQAPDQSAAPNPSAPSQDSAAQASGVQSFSGMVVKQGDKYMLQDESSGQTYDIDHQDEVQKYAGKRVKVHGTLDPSGKMIHLQ